METNSNLENVLDINRRQAIKRAGLMLGAALSASTVTSVLSAQTKAAGSKGKPKNLSRRQYALVGALAERILPRTDTPGAIDAGVPEFIDVMCGDYMTEEETKSFISGLKAFEKSSRAAHKGRFDKLAPAQQDELLRGLASAGESKKSGSFYRELRKLTISGYFTSEVVMKNVLQYDFIPGSYEGCVPISETGNVAWAH